MKTSELIGADLDYWVAKAEGYQRIRRAEINMNGIDPSVCITILFEGNWHDFRPSTDWSQAGPIIEREKITISYIDGVTEWAASIGDNPYPIEVITQMVERDGPTPLIAAMRAFVASKYGEEVEA